MPENTEYSSKVYNALRDNLEGFNKTETEFKESLKDPNYVSNVHRALTDNLEGFNKSEDDFKIALGVTSPKQSTSLQGAGSGVLMPSQNAPTKSTESPFTYPSYDGSSGSKSQTQESDKVAHINPQSVRAYEYAQKNTSDADKRLAHYKSSLNITQTDPSKIDSRWTEQKRQAEQYQALKLERDNLSAKSKQAIGNLKSTIDEVVGKAPLKQFESLDVDGLPYADAKKIDDYTAKISEYSGVPKDGYFNTLLRNELKAKTDWNIIEPDVNKTFDELYKKKYGKSKNEYEQEQFAKAFTGDEAIIAKSDLQLKNISTELQAQAKEQIEPIAKAYEQNANQINTTLNAKATEIQNKIQSLVNNGTLSIEDANKQLKAENDALVLEANAKLNESKESYLSNANNIYLKQQQRFKRHYDEIQKQSNIAIEKQSKEFSKKYKADPKYVESVKELYNQSLNMVYEQNAVAKKTLRGMKGGAVNYLQSTISSLGSQINGISTSLGYNDGAVLGQKIESMFNTGDNSIKSIEDLFDITKLTGSAGNLTGTMIPSTALAIGTGGVVSEPMAAAAISGLVSWGINAADMSGRVYSDKFAESGDVVKAGEAARGMLSAEMVKMPLAFAEMLPFTKGGLGFVKNKAAKIATGTTMEFGGELMDESFENIAENNVREGRDWHDLKEITKNYTDFKPLAKDIYETALNILPTAGMGAYSQIREVSEEEGIKKQKEAEINKLASSEILKQRFNAYNPYQFNQFIQDMYLKHGENFVQALAESSFAQGTIDKEIYSKILEQKDKTKELFDTAHKMQLSINDSKLYGMFMAQYDEQMDKANSTEDVNAKAVILEKAKKYNQQAIDVLNLQEVPHAIVKYGDGMEMVWSQEQIDNAMNDDAFVANYGNGNISVKLFNIEDGFAEKLNTKISNYNKRSVVEQKVESNNVNIQPQVGQGENVGGVGNEAEATPSVEAEVKSEIPQQKIDETTKSEEAVVPSEEGASGEDTNVGKAEEEKGVVGSERKIPTKGKSFIFSFLHNTEKSPQMGERYGQHIEPSGKYVIVGNAESVKGLPNYESGIMEFKNPLIIDFGGGYTEDSNWKKILSLKYGNKKGKKLSDAIKKDGYDGIVTISEDKYGKHTSEIISLTKETELQEKPQESEVVSEVEKAPTESWDKDVESTAKALEGVDTEQIKKQLGIKANWDMTGETDALVGNDAILAYTQKHLPDWNRESQKGNINPNSKLTYDIVKGKFGGIDQKDVVEAKDENGTTVGIVKLDNKGGIEHIVVAPEFRKKGVSNKLIEKLKENNPNLNLSKTKLRSKGFEKAFSSKIISEAYHAAKKDGSNPELVKAVEDLLGKPSEGKVENKQQINTDKNAVQEQSTGKVLQREQGEATKAGSKREGVESSKQGEEAAKQSEESIIDRTISSKKRISKIDGAKNNFSNETRALIGKLNESAENVVGWVELEGSKISGITKSGNSRIEKLGNGVEIEFYNSSTNTTSKYFVEGDANKIIPFIENFVRERKNTKEETLTNKENDKENKSGVQGNEREGQEPIETKPNESPSGKEAEASRDVQAQEKVTEQSKEIPTQQKQTVLDLEPHEQALYWAKKYNELPNKYKVLESGAKYMSEMQKLAKKHGFKVGLNKDRTVRILDSNGKQIKNKSVVRTKEDIELRKEAEDFRRRSLRLNPMSIKHGVALFLANGGRFDRKEVSRIMPTREGLGWFTAEKGGMKPEFFGEWLQNMGFNANVDEYGNPLSGAIDIINEIQDALDIYTTARKIKDVENIATEIAEEYNFVYENGGLTRSDVEHYKQKYEEQQAQEKYEQTMGWIDELSIDEKIKFSELQEQEREEYIKQLIKEHEDEENQFYESSKGDEQNDNGANAKELKATKRLESAKEELASKKATYEKLKTQLDKNGQQDQIDIFGKAKSEEMLFKNDIKEQEKQVADARREYEQAKENLDKAQAEYDIATSKEQAKIEFEAKEPTEQQQDYENIKNLKSNNAKSNAKTKFVEKNFDSVVAQMMLNNKIKRKC